MYNFKKVCMLDYKPLKMIELCKNMYGEEDNLLNTLNLKLYSTNFY